MTTDIENKVISFFEQLTEADLKNMDKIYADGAFFKDPFNELDGINQIEKIYAHMFESLTSPHFKVIDSLYCESKRSLFLTWDFIFILKKKEFVIHGSTHFKLNDSGLITYHRDYWDVGEELLSKIPVVKSFYKLLSSQLKV